MFECGVGLYAGILEYFVCLYVGAAGMFVCWTRRYVSILGRIGLSNRKPALDAHRRVWREEQEEYTMQKGFMFWNKRQILSKQRN